MSQRLLAEFVGTAILLAAVVGSGVMAVRLSAGNDAVALLANSLATVGALWVLIEVLGPVSGAHFNPAVSLVFAVRGKLGWGTALGYVAVQLCGAVAGVWLAHGMFELPILQFSARVRTGPAQWLAEAVATAGLLVVILRAPAARVPGLVAAWIGAAYWFTASTSFANPAAVVGRLLSDTFAGIAPANAAGFVVAELAGAAMGAVLARTIGGNGTAVSR
jgi:glycerol uptake facilitator-like aquaporin